MKVRIIKAKHQCYWYADKIGQEFEVMDSLPNTGHFYVKEGNYQSRGIDKLECEVIQEPTLTPFSFAAWDKDRSQKVFTRDGDKVTELTFMQSSKHDSLCGVLFGRIETWDKEGIYNEGGSGILDLFLEHTEKEYWVNVYNSETTGVYLGAACITKHFAEISHVGDNNFVKTISFKA